MISSFATHCDVFSSQLATVAPENRSIAVTYSTSLSDCNKYCKTGNGSVVPTQLQQPRKQMLSTQLVHSNGPPLYCIHDTTVEMPLLMWVCLSEILFASGLQTEFSALKILP